jgi:predicted dehydrogenase
MKAIIVGFGKVAIEHQKVFEYLGVEIVASINRSEDGRDRAKKFGVKQTFSSMNEIRAFSFDFFIICTSFQNNFSVVRDALNFQKPIFLEKPPAVSLSDFKELIAMKFSSKLIYVGFNRRHYPSFNKVISLLKEKEEELVSISVQWSENHEMIVSKYGNLSKKYFFANSIHAVDLLNYLGGTVKDYTVVSSEKHKSFKDLLLIGVSERQVMLGLSLSWYAPVKWKVEFIGCAGSRYICEPIEKLYEVRDGFKLDEIYLKETGFKVGFLEQAMDFLEHIDDFSSSPQSLVSALKSMEMCEEISKQVILQ